MFRKRLFPLLAAAVCLSALAAPALAFDWQKHKGATLTFVAGANPWFNAIEKYLPEFEKLTGITLKVDSLAEQQARQRMMTVLQSKGDDMDIFMSLKSRDGLLYANAGWYADLYPLLESATSPDYNIADFSKVPLDGEIFGGKLSGVPLNVEGPVMYYRKDVFKELGLNPPKTLAELEDVCKGIKEKKPGMVPFVTRGLKAALPFTFSVFLHNMGGDYVVDGKSALSSPIGKQSVDLYARILRDYGPPGAVNYNFYQIAALYRDGKAAMAFEATNAFNDMDNTGVMLLPAGPTGAQSPTVICWGLSISNFSKKKEAAWYFLQWATSAEMQARLSREGIFPSRMSVLNSEAFEEWQAATPIGKDWAAMLIKCSELGSANVCGLGVINQPEARDIVGQAVNEVMLGTKSLDAATADADRLFNALLAKERR